MQLIFYLLQGGTGKKNTAKDKRVENKLVQRKNENNGIKLTK